MKRAPLKRRNLLKSKLATDCLLAYSSKVTENMQLSSLIRVATSGVMQQPGARIQHDESEESTEATQVTQDALSNLAFTASLALALR